MLVIQHMFKKIGCVLMKLFSFKDKKRPWLKYYNKNEKEVEVPNVSLYEYLYESNIDRLDRIAINYFGNKTTYKDFLNQIDSLVISSLV